MLIGVQKDSGCQSYAVPIQEEIPDASQAMAGIQLPVIDVGIIKGKECVKDHVSAEKDPGQPHDRLARKSRQRQIRPLVGQSGVCADQLRVFPRAAINRWGRPGILSPSQPLFLKPRMSTLCGNIRDRICRRKQMVFICPIYRLSYLLISTGSTYP